jgi:hypothetical protein
MLKPEQPKESSILKRPTFYGYLVILLTVSGGIFGWVIENDKAKKQEIAELTHFKDSTNLAKDFKTINVKQILALNKQDKQIIADSIRTKLQAVDRIKEQNRYDTTLGRFSIDFVNQKTTLQRQQKSLENEKIALGDQITTLNHIEESGHPLLPFTASLRFLVHLPQGYLDNNPDFQKRLAALKGDTYNYKGDVFDERSRPGNYDLSFDGMLLRTKEDTSSKLEMMNLFVYYNFMPNFNLLFYADAVGKNTSSGGADLAMGTMTTLIPENDVRCNYHIYENKNERVIEVTLTFNEFRIDRNQGKILSMYSIRNGALVIDPRYLIRSPPPLQMLDAVITCGPDQRKYVVYVDASDQIPFSGDQEDFVKSGHEILTSPYQSRDFAPADWAGPKPHAR